MITCITAIYPARPPKLDNAALAQVRVASMNKTPCADLLLSAGSFDFLVAWISARLACGHRSLLNDVAHHQCA